MVDLYFAVLPWIFLWKLNMTFRRKISIAIILSLGFLYVIPVPTLCKDTLTFIYRAFGCGIVRTIELSGFLGANYTSKIPSPFPQHLNPRTSLIFNVSI